MRPFFISLFALLLLASTVSAHENEISFEKEKNGYSIDAGYSASSVSEGESLRMDFALRKNGKDVPFTDTWVKITAESGAVVFASSIHNAEFGGPRMSYIFPKEGKYTVSFRYENNADTLVDDSFVIDVTPAKNIAWSVFGVSLLPLFFGVAGVLFGVLIMLIPLIVKGRKLSKSSQT